MSITICMCPHHKDSSIAGKYMLLYIMIALLAYYRPTNVYFLTNKLVLLEYNFLK